MKKLILAGALFLLPFAYASAASTDYFLKIEGVDGEAIVGASSPTLTVQGNLVVESGKAVVGATVILDGTRSTDDGAIHRFLWKQVSGPTAVLTNAASAKALFVPKSGGTYVFELTATDATGLSSPLRRVTVEVATASIVPISPPTGSTGAGPALLEIDTIKGESGSSKGKVEMDWKVEKGESAAPGVEPDEIDYDDDGQPITPDFSILLGGSGESTVDQDDDGDGVSTAEEGLERALEILSENAKASDQAIESVSLNYEKITTRVRHGVKLFGFIPVTAVASIDIDAEEQVDVRFPWWAMFATGKDGDALGERVMTTLSNVLKTKHDSIKNAIQNIR